MCDGRKFERIYLKYVVKSPLLFYAYLGVFISIFMIAASNLQLEERQAYEAEIYGDKIEIPCDSALDLWNDKIYLYKDRNQEVLHLDVEEAEYRDGVMCILLSQSREDVTGRVTVEIISEKSTLLQKIFLKAGT